MPPLQFICWSKELHEWSCPFYQQLNPLKKSNGLLCFYANSKAPNLQTNDFNMSILYRTHLKFSLDNNCCSTTEHYRKEWCPHTCWRQQRLSEDLDTHPHEARIRHLDTLTWAMSQKAQQWAGLLPPTANPDSSPGVPSSNEATPPQWQWRPCSEPELLPLPKCNKQSSFLWVSMGAKWGAYTYTSPSSITRWCFFSARVALAKTKSLNKIQSLTT